MADPLTEKIIGAAIEVHRILGPGLFERIYEEALCIELGLRGIPFERQIEADVHYKDQTIKGQRLDLVVNGEVVVELKAVSDLPDVATAQALSYLNATKLKRGLLINFNKSRLIDGIKGFLCELCGSKKRLKPQSTQRTQSGEDGLKR